MASGLAGTRFQGDPSRPLGPDADEEDDNAGAEEQGEQLEGNSGVPSRFSEVHRLAYVVSAIDDDTSLVPKGALAITPTHTIEPNARFGGLAPSEAGDLACYLHFRERAASRRGKVRHSWFSGAVRTTMITHTIEQ